ncbi:MAG TPA: glycosyltransferase family 39 protein [Nitrososphaeraceae archaeon]|nr:glycosyltransferase family 39 protein [Nitrososphaeraceae archaeon]
MLSIPLVLSAYTHLWNPVGFPYPDFDEGIYMRRAMHVLSGQGPQEVIGSFALYDHPYFGQLFLAGTLGMIGYPNSLTPVIGNVQSIESLYMAPRILMGILAIVDTFLIYAVSQRRYNKTVALIASVLFAVFPFTWLIRSIWLESIQLPFILASIFCAVNVKYSNNEKKSILILLSGVLLGIAIFTKVPAVTMIPVVAYLVLTNSNRNLKSLILCFIPMLLIPMLWPVYSIYEGQFSSWMHGIYGQSHREGVSLLSSITDFFKLDPVIVILGISGLVFAVLKKDFLILLWIVPLLIFLSSAAGTSYFHLLPILPALCIGAARLIDLSKKIAPKKIQWLTPLLIISIAAFGLIFTTVLIGTNVNNSYFKAEAFLTQYLSDAYKLNGSNGKITVVSDPFYLWIPQYVFNLKHDYVPFYMIVSIKTEKVAFVIDRSFFYGLSGNLSGNAILKKIYDSYDAKRQEAIKIGDPMKDGAVVILGERPSTLQGPSANLIGMNNTWKSFNGASVSQDGLLHIRTNSNNSDTKYSGAVLHTQINLKERPLLLNLKYKSESLNGNTTFFVEITEDKNEGKTLRDYVFNTLYTEITEKEKGGMTPWEDLEKTFYEEISKGKEGGKILWNAHLDETSGNFRSETFVFPRLGAIGYPESSKGVPVQVKFYIQTQGTGVNDLIVKQISIS